MSGLARSLRGQRDVLLAGTAAAAVPTSAPATDACWRTIGVRGEHSCPQLASVTHCRNCSVFARAALTLYERLPSSADASAQADADTGDTGTHRSAELERLFLFELGSTVCALECALIDEVTADVPLRRLAHRGGGLLEGVVNVRGELLLSVALHRLLSLGEDAGDAGACRRRVLIGGSQGQRFSFRAHRVLGIQYAPSRALEPAPLALPHPLDRLLRGIARLPEASSGSALNVHVLDGRALLQALSQGV